MFSLNWNNFVKSSVFRQSALALSGNIGYAASQWGTLIVLAHFTNPASIGQYALALSICAPVIMFSNMRLRLLLAADAKDEYEFNTYLTARYYSTALALFIILFFSYIIFGNSLKFLIVLVIALAKSIEAISDIYYGLYQRHKKIENMTISLYMKGGGSFLMFFLLIYIYNDLLIALISLPVMWLALLLGYDMPASRKLLARKNANYKTVRKIPQQAPLEHGTKNISILLIRSALVLGFVALIGSLFYNGTRYVISISLGDTQLGIYATIAYIGVAGQLVAASFVQPIMPNLALNFRAGNYSKFMSNYRYLLVVASLLGVTGIVFSIVFGKIFLNIVYGELYSKYHFLFIIVMISASLSYFILYQWYILTAMQKLKEQLILSGITLLVLVTLSLIWTKQYGLEGAVGAEIAAMALHIALGLWLVRKCVKERLCDAT